MLEYMLGAHCSGAEVTDEEHLDHAGHDVHVSITPFEYILFPQVELGRGHDGWPGIYNGRRIFRDRRDQSVEGSQKNHIGSTHDPRMIRMHTVYIASRGVTINKEALLTL
jgi:hypothetical protein